MIMTTLVVQSGHQKDTVENKVSLKNFLLFLLSLGPKRKYETTVQNQKEPFIWVNDQKEEQKALQRRKKNE